MNRFETASHQGIYWAIALSVVTVFIIDMNTKIGVATWMLYLLPLLMCFLVWKPWLPILVAGAATILIVADWFLSPVGIAADVARVNRGIGLVVTWAAALLARNSLETRVKLRQEEWMRTARTRIADAVSGEQALGALATKVLRVLIDYLGAQAATLYVAERSGVYSRAAAIGLPPDVPAPQTINAGDGLLGRAVAENRPMRLEQLPPDYLKISSALGSSKPHALLVAPLNIEGVPQGVVELAFLQPTYD